MSSFVTSISPSPWRVVVIIAQRVRQGTLLRCVEVSMPVKEDGSRSTASRYGKHGAWVAKSASCFNSSTFSKHDGATECRAGAASRSEAELERCSSPGYDALEASA